MVRFWEQSGHGAGLSVCPLMTQSGRVRSREEWLRADSTLVRAPVEASSRSAKAVPSLQNSSFIATPLQMLPLFGAQPQLPVDLCTHAEASDCGAVKPRYLCTGWHRGVGGCYGGNWEVA